MIEVLESSNIVVNSLHRRLEKWKHRLNSLTQDYEDLFDQMDAEDDTTKIKKFEKKLESIEKQVQIASENCKRLQFELKNSQNNSKLSRTDDMSNEKSFSEDLIEILLEYENKISELTSQAYDLVLPKGWLGARPATLQEMLRSLEELPQGNGPNPLVKFAAILSINTQIPAVICQRLVVWGKQKSRNFEVLHTQMKTEFLPKLNKKEKARAYLLIVVEETLINSERYWINGYLIHDEVRYQQQLGDGYKTLKSNFKGKLEYSRAEIALLVEGYLEQCDGYNSIEALYIEVFLPESLLQLAVETWGRKNFNDGFPMCIGYDYTVCIRSIERWKEYGNFHQRLWKRKWERLVCELGARADYSVRDIDENLDYGDLLTAFSTLQAFKLNKAPNMPTDIFKAVLEKAIPIGLWVRRDLPDPNSHQKDELRSLLKCCLQDLPHKVQAKRAETLQQKYRSEDSHIGHHLVLLWEDPNRLPPAELEFTPEL